MLKYKGGLYREPRCISWSVFSAIVSTIETYRSGWWWSISQEIDKVGISFGPDLSANAFDRQFLCTPTGDNGYVGLRYVTPETRNEQALSLCAELLSESLEDLRKFTVPEGVRCRPMKPVRQTPLTDSSAYDAGVALAERYNVREYYLGACWRSADCSVRLLNGVDISEDLQAPDATIWDASAAAWKELIVEISA